MKKIVSLFQRNYEGDRLVRDEIVPGAEWVAVGEGVATVKYDGTCCLWRDGHLFKRYELKRGKTPPPDFEPAQDADAITGDVAGWVPVGDGPDDKYHREACESLADGYLDDGTYELVGPKIQGNPESWRIHTFIRHGATVLTDVPRDFDGLKSYLSAHPEIEGIVWHHPDGRMVKLKGKDFGIKRVPRVGVIGGAA